VQVWGQSMKTMLAEPVQWFFEESKDDLGPDSDEELEFFLAQRKCIKAFGRRGLDYLAEAAVDSPGKEGDGQLHDTSSCDSGIDSPRPVGSILEVELHETSDSSSSDSSLEDVDVGLHDTISSDSDSDSLIEEGDRQLLLDSSTASGIIIQRQEDDTALHETSSCGIEMSPPPQFTYWNVAEEDLDAVEVSTEGQGISGLALAGELSSVCNPPVEAALGKNVQPPSKDFVKLSLGPACERPEPAKHLALAIAGKLKAICKPMQGQAGQFQQRVGSAASRSVFARAAKTEVGLGYVTGRADLAKGVVKALVAKSKSLSVTAKATSTRMQMEAELATNKTIDCAREQAQIAKGMVKTKIMMFEAKSGGVSVETPEMGVKGRSLLRGPWVRGKPGGA